MKLKQYCLNASLVLSSFLRTPGKLLLVSAVAAVVIAATFVQAESDRDRPEHNNIAGTWISTEFGGSSLASFMSDGRVIFTGPIDILTGNGPGGGNELASPAAGEWIRTGNREFTTTSFSVLSSPVAGFTHLIKLTGNYKLDRASDELTLSGAMVAVLLPDGTPQFPPFPGGVLHYKRVIAGQ